MTDTVETAYSLEDEVGVSLGPVFVNGVYPQIDGLTADPDDAAKAAGAGLHRGEADAMRAAADFRLKRMALQAEQLARLNEQLPLPQIQLPYLFTADLGPDHVDLLARAALDGIEALLALPSEASA